jgi:hypothetical protein
VIRPLPWANAPKADGSTFEFKERLAWCKEQMEHLANHTPHHFLTHMNKAAHQEKKTVSESNGVKQKVVDKGQSRKQKRKVRDGDEDDAGMFGAGVTYLPMLT